MAHSFRLGIPVRQHLAILRHELLLVHVPRPTQLRDVLIQFPEDLNLLHRFACPNKRQGAAHRDGQDRALVLHDHRCTQPREPRLPTIGGVACEGVVGGHMAGLPSTTLRTPSRWGCLKGYLSLPPFCAEMGGMRGPNTAAAGRTPRVHYCYPGRAMMAPSSTRRRLIRGGLTRGS